jgi:hypothetical protein
MLTPHPKHSINVAARMAHWSGRHRKKAFWGWLAFVVIVFMAGNMVGTTQISDVDPFSGESHQGLGGARPRRSAPCRRGRLHPERLAHHRGS